MLDRLEPGNPAYNMPYAVRFRGLLRVEPLRASIGELLRRYEALRTTFVERDGVPAQHIHPPIPAALPALDLRGLPAVAREAEALRLAEVEALRPFDLTRGPMLRSGLLRLDDADHVLLLTLHLVVSDGWSTGVLVREMSVYAVWQRDRLAGEVLDHQLAWWRDQPVQGPNATGDWRTGVERRVTRLGMPEVAPFFLHAVELAWEGAPAPTEFATAYDLYERLEGAIISIASAVVIARLALKHPELTVAIGSARDPKPARDGAKQETIPWLRAHPGCVSGLRKSLHLLPRDHLFIVYVEATLAAASAPPPASGDRRNRKKKRK